MALPAWFEARRLPEGAVKTALGFLLAAAAGALAVAVNAGLIEAKSLLAPVAGLGFALIALADVEWGYWLFLLLACILPSRFNQEYYTLLGLHFTVYDPLLAVLGVAWLLRLFRERRVPRLSLHLLWMLAWLTLILVSASVVLSKYQLAGKLYAGIEDWVRIALFFLVTYQLLDDSRRLERYMDVIAVGSFIVAAYGLYSYFFVKSHFAFAGGPVKAFSFEKRLIVGSMIGGGATTLAGFLTLTTPLVFTRWLTEKIPWRKLVYLGILGTQGFMMVLTFSRGGWMALSFALLLGLLAMSRNVLKIILSACVFLVLIAALWNFMPRAVHDRFETVFNPHNEANTGRLEIWAAAKSKFRESPWIGTGPNNYYNTAIAFNQAERFPIYISPYHPHNWLLLSLVESGVIGTIFLFGYLAIVAVIGLMRLRTAPPGTWNGYEFGIWAGMIGFILHNQVDYFLWQPRVAFVFWLVVLLVVRSTRPGPAAEPC